MGRYELKYKAEEIDELLESVDEKTIYSDATVQTHGLMAASDKEKLDDLPTAMGIEHYLDGKANKKVPSRVGNFAKLKDDGDIADSGCFVDDFATAQQGLLAQTAYQKPKKGIPYSDLEDDVKSSLDKADTALQSFTEQDPTVPSWAKQSSKPSYDYTEIGNTPDLSGFITKSVNDLANYYLKSETYTKSEVSSLISAIQQFHYEIYASLPQSGESNVLYLIGPTGSGADRYEEYVYANNAFTKIGDTSIDLSGYVTTSALNTALESYATTQDLEDAVENVPIVEVDGDVGILKGISGADISHVATKDGLVYAIGEGNANGYYEDKTLATTDYVDDAIGDLATVATSGSYNDLTNKPTIPAAQVNSDWNASSGVAQILNKPTIPTVPTNVSAFTNDAGYLTQHQSLTNYVQKSQTAGLLKNDGTVDTNTYLTSHQDISGKADKITIASSMPSGGFLPNVVYNLGALSGDTTFLMASATDNTIANIWYWTFDTPSTAPTITWPQAITAWNGGSAPTINASKHYEVSVMNGIACIIEA